MDKYILEKLDELIDLDNNLEDDGIYKFKDKFIPRVSNILKDTISKEYLANWAASIGKRYYYESQKAKDIGTLTHQWIEEFLTKKKITENFTFSQDVLSIADIAYNNFLEWYNKFTKKYSFNVISIEKELACPYYGGTTDCIVNINGHNSLIDFKTSKKIDYTYIMQLCAYMWIINNYYQHELPFIDTIGIIRVGKDKYGVYEDLFLNISDINQSVIINRATEAFMIATQHFYSIHNLYYIMDNYSKEYQIENVLKGE